MQNKIVCCYVDLLCKLLRWCQLQLDTHFHILPFHKWNVIEVIDMPFIFFIQLSALMHPLIFLYFIMLRYCRCLAHFKITIKINENKWYDILRPVQFILVRIFILVLWGVWIHQRICLQWTQSNFSFMWRNKLLKFCCIRQFSLINVLSSFLFSVFLGICKLLFLSV